MKSKEYILNGLTPLNVEKSLDEINELIHEYGVVIFPNFYSSDDTYLRFYKDLQKSINFICENHGLGVEVGELGEALSRVLNQNPEVGRLIANLGTQPNKFASFNELKFSSLLSQIASNYFGTSSLVMTPQAGDTLHIFPPGNRFHQYNLPIHQDYQYLMQSPSQLTFYLGISEYKENVGGLRFWERSHADGVIRSTKNQNGAYVLQDESFDPHRYEEVTTAWNSGDLGIFHSLLCHSSIPNTSNDHTRIVQIFRFSDCNDEIAKSYDFQSTSYPRRGVEFESVHSELFSSQNNQMS